MNILLKIWIHVPSILASSFIGNLIFLDNGRNIAKVFFFLFNNESVYKGDLIDYLHLFVKIIINGLFLMLTLLSENYFKP